MRFAIPHHGHPQDVQEDLKLSLDNRIERALSEQAWQALARELLRNNHLQARSDIPSNVYFYL